MKIIIYILCVFFGYNTILWASENLTLMSGFPVSTTADFFSSGAIADIDADGIKEYIVGDKAGYLYAVQPDGSMKSGFPVLLSNAAIWSSPAIADIDGDGYAEIIIGSYDNKLHIIRHDGSIQKNFPFTTNGQVRGAPVIADINKDGKPDIIFTSGDGNLYVTDESGENLSGWPQRITPNTTNENHIGAYSSRTTVAVSDYDGNGFLEIIAVTNGGVYTGFRHTGKRIFSGSAGSIFDAAPAVADLDGDGIPEFILISWNYYVYVFNISADGRIIFKPNFPYYSGMQVRGQPVIYDINNDGNLDMLFYAIGGSSHFLAIDVNGNVIALPQNANVNVGATYPLAGDIFNNNKTKIITGSHLLKIFIIDFDNEEVDSYIINGIIESTPVIGDFDGDGNCDIVFASGVGEQKIYALTTGASFDYSKMIVTKFRNTLNNTGNYADFSTPLIYEPKKTIIHDTKVIFKWLQMEGVGEALSSYKFHNTAWSDYSADTQLELNNLADGEYIFQVKHSFNNKESLTPAYKKIIIDNTLPTAKLDINAGANFGGRINLNGSASDANFEFYEIKIFHDSNLINVYTNALAIDTGILYSFDSTDYSNGEYLIILTVYENDTEYFSVDSVVININNNTDTFVFTVFNEVSFDNDNLKIEIPEYVFKNNFSVKYYMNNLVAADTARVSDIYGIEFDTVAARGKLTLKLKIDSAKMQTQKFGVKYSFAENFIPVIYYKSFDASSVWENIGGVYDPLKNIITAAIDKSGYFTVFYVSANSGGWYQINENEISISRRISDGSESNKIYINGINAPAHISVYDLNGKLIKRSSGYYWDCRDNSGKKVPVGTYIILVEYNNIKKKFVIYIK